MALDMIMPMPVFADGIHLTATDLNRLTTGQQYAANKLPLNYGRRGFVKEADYWIFHQHRYLHYLLSTPGDEGEIWINDVLRQTVHGVSSGTLDLQSYGLPLNQAYKVRWKGVTVNGIFMQEHPHSLIAVALPYAIPTFGPYATVTADQLNRVARNTEYYISKFSTPMLSGFRGTRNEQLLPASDHFQGIWSFWVPHVYRYVYAAARCWVGGANTGVRDFHVYANGSLAYEDTFQSESYFAVSLDWQNTNHTIYQGGTGHPIAMPAQPTLGGWYQITVRVTANVTSDINDAVTLYMVAETPTAMFI